jgi:hypothetical protein
MARDGLDMDSSTLWEQTWFLSQHLAPTYEANHAHVLSADVIAVDETWWRLMKKRLVGLVAREDAVSYRLLSSRSTDAARTVLGDYASVAICDGYKVYDVLAWEREGSDLTLAHCWVHVRRKFVEAEPHYPETSEILDRIGQLYAIEAETKRASPEEPGHTGRGALRLAHRVGEAVRRRALRLPRRGGPAGHPVSRGRDARARSQVVEADEASANRRCPPNDLPSRSLLERPW